MAVRVMTCGASRMHNESLVHEVLGLIHEVEGVSEVVQADPTGSDYYAGAWAREMGIPTALARGDILQHGAFKRKRHFMPSEEIDLLLAFPGWETCGLYNPVERARGSGIKVFFV